MFRAGIIGASGYTGAELLRLLAGHAVHRHPQHIDGGGFFAWSLGLPGHRP